MKTTKEKIAIMQAFEDGKEVGYYVNDIWILAQKPNWNWEFVDFEIKPIDIIDWSKVAVDTPVICLLSFRRYFSHVDGDKAICCFIDGRTSRAGNVATKAWMRENVTLDLEAKCIMNWIPNTGDRPKSNYLLLKFGNGSIRVEKNNNEWSLDDPCPITHYAVIS